MKQAVRSVIAILVLAASSFAGVTVTSPAPGSTSGSPVHFVASASSTLPITAMRIYVDSVSTYTISSSTLNTSLAIAPGAHSVVVQAWDSSGAVFKSSENIDVTTASASGGVTVSSPGNNSTVSSPIHVTASAASPNPITAMRIYLDGASVFTINGASLDTQVAAASGSHYLRRWQSGQYPPQEA